VNPEVNEADVLEQQRELAENEEQEATPPTTVDAEADPADLSDQNRPVPSEEEDWPDA